MKKEKYFFGEVKLSWNHGRMNCCWMMIFSDEDEAAEEQIEETDLEMAADSFAD